MIAKNQTKIFTSFILLLITFSCNEIDQPEIVKTPLIETATDHGTGLLPMTDEEYVAFDKAPVLLLNSKGGGGGA